jgi:hypothetical protein
MGAPTWLESVGSALGRLTFSTEALLSSTVTWRTSPFIS